MALPVYHKVDIRTLDLDILVAVVDTAKADAAGTTWVAAIARAYDWFLTNEGCVLVGSDGSALIERASSDTTYNANGVCGCQVFKYNRLCWHRAAARLLKRYQEAKNKAERQAAHEKALREVNELFNY